MRKISNKSHISFDLSGLNWIFSSVVFHRKKLGHRVFCSFFARKQRTRSIWKCQHERETEKLSYKLEQYFFSLFSTELFFFSVVGDISEWLSFPWNNKKSSYIDKRTCHRFNFSILSGYSLLIDKKNRIDDGQATFIYVSCIDDNLNCETQNKLFMYRLWWHFNETTWNRWITLGLCV